MRSKIARLALVVVGLGAALGLAELAVRAWVPVRNVGPAFSVYDAEDGKRLKRSVSLVRRTPEFTMRLTTNADGFRGPALPADPAGAVVFLGDSFTLGYGVDDGEEFPALVRAALVDARGAAAPPVVNAGIGNAGNGRWLTLLRREGARFAPALVVLQVSGSDFGDNRAEGLFMLDEGGGVTALPGAAPRHPLRAAQGVVEAIPGLSGSHLFCLALQALTPGRPGTGEVPSGAFDPAVVDPLTPALVDVVVDLCDAQGWPVLALGVALTEAQAASLEPVWTAHATPYLPIPPRAERPDLYYAVDGHWNAAGHAEVARRLLAQPLLAGLVAAAP